MNRPRDLLLLLALAGPLLLTACENPFARTGPKFDAHQPAAGLVTNFTSVPLTNAVVPELLHPNAEPFTIGPGDKLELELLGDPSTRTIVAVGPDGRIYFYLLPGTDVWGLTLGQTKELLERELSKYVAGAQVSVTLRGIESKRVWLLGRVHNSGIYPVGAPMTLLEAISMAGGLLTPTGPGTTGTEELADLQHSFVVRGGEFMPVDFERLIREGDLTQNIYLRNDDFIYVPSTAAHEIYVLGAVRLPKPVVYAQAKTLIAAITDCGGTVKGAYLSHVGIIRGSLTQPRIAIIDYKALVSGKAPDVRLQPRDVVYVPFSPYQNLVKYVNLILDTFTRTEAINEGARFAIPNAAPVGVAIGVGGH
jgi:protein involved in polysaccharide export with SLBB domain